METINFIHATLNNAKDWKHFCPGSVVYKSYFCPWFQMSCFSTLIFCLKMDELLAISQYHALNKQFFSICSFCQQRSSFGFFGAKYSTLNGSRSAFYECWLMVDTKIFCWSKMNVLSNQQCWPKKVITMIFRNKWNHCSAQQTSCEVHAISALLQ